jgi:peptide/nickel transport system permease protein
VSPSYLLKRIATILFTLFVVSVLVFGITQVLPGDAAAMMLGENATPEQLAGLRARLGLDAPVAAQYGRWLAAILQGDLGTSLRTGLPVGAMVVPALGRSLLLAFLSITLMLVVAVPLGIVAALRRGGVADLGVGLAPMWACPCRSS